MSRIAKNPVSLPKGVEVAIGSGVINVKGTKGQLQRELHQDVEIKQEDNVLTFASRNGSSFANAMAGTTRALINNMVVGVTEGFEKNLALVGIGYRAQAKGKVLNLVLGFSHPVDYQVPEGVTIETPSPTEIIIKGIDKQIVGQVAAEIRAYRPPEPYKGKGVRYKDETIMMKEAKKNKVGVTVDKKIERMRRSRRARAKIKELGAHRLCIHRTPRHIYAQVIKPNGSEVVVSVSTLDADTKSNIQGASGNVSAATIVGKLIAEKAKIAGVSKVAFDRSGFKFHGRVKALADAARENGLDF